MIRTKLDSSRLCRIAFLETSSPKGDAQVGGSQISLLRTIEALRDRGYEIAVISLNGFSLLKDYQLLGCDVFTYNSGNGKPKPSDSGNNLSRKRIRSLLRRLPLKTEFIAIHTIAKYHGFTSFILNTLNCWNADILHCNNSIKANYSGIIAAMIKRIPCIQHQRNLGSVLPSAYSFLSRFVDAFISISHSVESSLLEKTSISKNKSHVIYNWERLPNEFLLKDYCVAPRGDFKMLWAGRIIPWKGLDLLIEFAIKLRDRGFPFKIYVAGKPNSDSTTYLASIIQDLHRNNLDNAIIFMGYVPRDKLYSSHYDLLVHTSVRPEPFGRVIIEAMKNGIPVAATNMGGPTEIIKHGENGFLYDPMHIESLVEMVINLAHDAELTRSLVQNAWNTLTSLFSERNSIELLIQLYNQVMTKSEC